MKRLVPCLMLSCSLLGFANGCYQDALSEPGLRRVRTRVFLTDAPFPFGSVGSVEVYVLEIAASTVPDSSSDTRVWSVLGAPMARFDLMQLQQSKLALLSETEISTGRLHAVRVTIDCDSSMVRYEDGETANVRWPHGGSVTVLAQVEAPISIAETGASLVIDFDVGQSFTATRGDPLHDFVFTPVIRAVEAGGTGSLSGTIRGDNGGDGAPDPLHNALASLFRGDPSASPDTWSKVALGHTDSGGYYKLGFLLPGTYLLRLETPSHELFGGLLVHEVEIVAGEDFTFSVTLPATSASWIPSWR